jgi:uncharacterized protein YwgA
LKIEKFRYLAGIIAAHPGHELVARTRLQKTVRLLQRKGLPTDYDYMTHFFGPYSEGIQADIGLLESFGMVSEKLDHTADGAPFYTLTAKPDCRLKELAPFQKYIDIMAAQQTVILELAATYDAFREQGDTHDQAVLRVRRKKGTKCDDGRLDRAFNLLRELELPMN